MHNRITMNRLSIQQRVQVINALVEGNSIRATCRITGTAKGTVLRLLAEVGVAGAAVATYRRQTLLPEEALVVAARPSLPPWPRIGWASAALALIVVISMAGIGVAAYFVGTSRGNPERFTEFYVLGPGGQA